MKKIKTIGSTRVASSIQVGVTRVANESSKITDVHHGGVDNID